MIVGPIREPLQVALASTIALCVVMQLQSPTIGFWDLLGVALAVVIWRLGL